MCPDQFGEVSRSIVGIQLRGYEVAVAGGRKSFSNAEQRPDAGHTLAK